MEKLNEKKKKKNDTCFYYYNFIISCMYLNNSTIIRQTNSSIRYSIFILYMMLKMYQLQMEIIAEDK